MSKRSEEYMEEFAHVLNTLGPIEHALVLDGSIEICPCCDELSAYAWQDADAYDDENPIYANMAIPKGKIGHIGTAGCWEWECAHCHRHLMDANSPLNSPCYTHEDDDCEEDEDEE